MAFCVDVIQEGSYCGLERLQRFAAVVFLDNLAAFVNKFLLRPVALCLVANSATRNNITKEVPLGAVNAVKADGFYFFVTVEAGLLPEQHELILGKRK